MTEARSTTGGIPLAERPDALHRAVPARGFFARLVGVRPDARTARAGFGAHREEAVTQRLGRLPDRWHVLHAVGLPVAGEAQSGPIAAPRVLDHLVIGPGGVFTITAKHHPNVTVWVAGSNIRINGARVPYENQARVEAQRAGRCLAEIVGGPVNAVGIIAFVCAPDQLAIKEQPSEGVLVMHLRQVDRWLRTTAEILDDRTVTSLVAAARRMSGG